MDINIGNHCEHSSCNTLDFLPFKCDFCKKYFCEYHAPAHVHSCNEYLEFLDNSIIKSTEDRNKYTKCCAMPNCIVTGISNIVRCSKCNKNYCLSHRFPDIHSCENDDLPFNPPPPHPPLKNKRKKRMDRCEFM